MGGVFLSGGPLLLLVPPLAYSMTMRMEAIRSFETSVVFRRNAWRYISEDWNILSYRCEEIKSKKVIGILICLCGLTFRSVEMLEVIQHETKMTVF
jgi:hypothetical protein